MKCVFLSGCLTVVFSVFVAGQAIVEHSAATAAGSAAAAGGSKGVSKSVGGVFGSLSKTLEKTGEPASANAEGKPARVDGSPSAAGAAYKPKTIEPGEIAVGTARSDLLNKFGEPFMRTSRVEGLQFVESFYYKGTQDIVVVTLREGKVTAVSPPAEEQDSDKTAAL